MKKCIVFDLDETLISSIYRQYHVIDSFFKANQLIHNRDFAEYESIRIGKQLTNFEYFKLVNKEGVGFDDYFRDYFIENIEHLNHLYLDTLIVDTELFRQVKQKGYNYILLSLRSNESNSLKQLEKLSLLHFFDKAIFVLHDKHSNPKTPVLDYLKSTCSIEAFVGDSVNDYNAANDSNVKFIKVNTGIYPFESASQSFETINDYLKYLLNE